MINLLKVNKKRKLTFQFNTSMSKQIMVVSEEKKTSIKSYNIVVQINKFNRTPRLI